MLSRIGSSLMIGGFFAILLYTTNGCGGIGLTSPRQFASLAGLVTDAVTGTAVSNASVTERQHSGTALTNPVGRYFLSTLDLGSVRIEVTKTGYEPFSTTTILKEGSNTLDVQLRASP